MSPLRLLVVGDALLDRDVVGTVGRHVPDAPEAPVVDVEVVHERPGGAGLAALLCARPGVVVTLATALGEDDAGSRVALGLAEAGVVVATLANLPATVGKTRVRDGERCVVRLDDAGHLLDDTRAPQEGAGRRAAPDTVLLRRLLADADAVLVADYGGPLLQDPAVRAELAAATARVPVVWDPHPRGLPPVAGVSTTTPNRAEAERVTLGAADGVSADRMTAAELAERLQRTWELGTVTVTDGAHGATTVDDTGGVHHATAPPVVVVEGATLDTCGAGDRFAGAVAVALGRGLQVPDAAAEAVVTTSAWLAAGGVATLAGDRPVLADASRDRPAAPGAPPADVPGGDASGGDGRTVPPAVPSSRATGVPAVDAVRAAGGTVVATGGCFDVLHAGHLALLQTAAAMGDCLVVLLNSDRSVRRLKGPQRPVQPVEDRTRLLEALRCVDAVVVFDEDTPAEALSALRPDVWVKGGDYDPYALPEAPTVLDAGGRVEVVPVVAGRSTTAILARGPAASRPTRTHPLPEGAVS